MRQVNHRTDIDGSSSSSPYPSRVPSPSFLVVSLSPQGVSLNQEAGDQNLHPCVRQTPTRSAAKAL